NAPRRSHRGHLRFHIDDNQPRIDSARLLLPQNVDKQPPARASNTKAKQKAGMNVQVLECFRPTVELHIRR
ncbi:hypothetical protein RA279_28650, partial [Pseudomonas syringae pv. tagetis]